MTAHPIELIAGIHDGLDLDESDQVTRHIASCDTCRTIAGAMQRVDRLIAMPEPTLPLPQPTAPRQRVPVAGWTFVVTVVLAVAVASSVLAVPFRQTQVTTAATDTCALLATAANSAGVRGAPPSPSKLEPPSSLSGTWSACGYGGGSDQAGPRLLFRSTPTAGREVVGLLATLTAVDGAHRFSFGDFGPIVADPETERLSSTSDLGHAIALVADPYFFVVAVPNEPGVSANIDRLAEAVWAELRRRPWPPLSEASKTDACTVIRRAAAAAGIPPINSTGAPAQTYRHPTDTSARSSLTSIWRANNVCALLRDESWHDPHLWIREEPTSLAQATVLLPNVFAFDAGRGIGPSAVQDWVQIDVGMWLGHGQSSFARPGEPTQTKEFVAVAVSDDPQFFVVTQAADAAAIQLARAVLEQLRRP